MTISMFRGRNDSLSLMPREVVMTSYISDTLEG